jgi:hypothetical protein
MILHLAATDVVIPLAGRLQGRLWRGTTGTGLPVTATSAFCTFLVWAGRKVELRSTPLIASLQGVAAREWRLAGDPEHTALIAMVCARAKDDCAELERELGELAESRVQPRLKAAMAF